MSSSFLPYGRQSVTDDDVAAVVAALRSDWLTTGPEVTAFEADISAWAGGAGVATVSNGTPRYTWRTRRPVSAPATR